MSEFTDLLKRAGLTKAALARILKLNIRTVSHWGDDPPGYAVAYLELLITYNRIRP